MRWADAKLMVEQGKRVMRPHWHWCWLERGASGETRLVHEDQDDTEPFRVLLEDEAAKDWIEVPE